jgi:hypothetical protein
MPCLSGIKAQLDGFMYSKSAFRFLDPTHMSLDIHQVRAHARMGDLLISAGIVDSADVMEALQVSKRLRIPLGRVLTAAECITKHMLEAVLQAQKTVRQGLNSELALQALALVASEQISFAEARSQVNRHRLNLVLCQVVLCSGNLIGDRLSKIRLTFAAVLASECEVP